MKTNIEMAREAGMFRLFKDPNAPEVLTGESIERFAELARADEREACADLCYQLVDNSRETRFAAAIRARGNT